MLLQYLHDAGVGHHAPVAQQHQLPVQVDCRAVGGQQLAVGACCRASRLCQVSFDDQHLLFAQVVLVELLHALLHQRHKASLLLRVWPPQILALVLLLIPLLLLLLLLL
jgi:hypothetical protein